MDVVFSIPTIALIITVFETLIAVYLHISDQRVSQATFEDYILFYITIYLPSILSLILINTLLWYIYLVYYPQVSSSLSIIDCCCSTPNKYYLCTTILICIVLGTSTIIIIAHASIPAIAIYDLFKVLSIIISILGLIICLFILNVSASFLQIFIKQTKQESISMKLCLVIAIAASVSFTCQIMVCVTFGKPLSDDFRFIQVLSELVYIILVLLAFFYICPKYMLRRMNAANELHEINAYIGNDTRSVNSHLKLQYDVQSLLCCNIVLVPSQKLTREIRLSTFDVKKPKIQRLSSKFTMGLRLIDDDEFNLKVGLHVSYYNLNTKTWDQGIIETLSDHTVKIKKTCMKPNFGTSISDFEAQLTLDKHGFEEIIENKRQKVLINRNEANNFIKLQLFGVDPSELEESKHIKYIPKVLVHLKDLLYEVGKNKNGLFVTEPNRDEANKYKHKMERDRLTQFDYTGFDAHILCYLIALFYQEMPDKCLSSLNYDTFDILKHKQDIKDKINYVAIKISKLNQPYRALYILLLNIFKDINTDNDTLCNIFKKKVYTTDRDDTVIHEFIKISIEYIKNKAKYDKELNIIDDSDIINTDDIKDTQYNDEDRKYLSEILDEAPPKLKKDTSIFIENKKKRDAEFANQLKAFGQIKIEKVFNQKSYSFVSGEEYESNDDILLHNNQSNSNQKIITDTNDDVNEDSYNI